MRIIEGNKGFGAEVVRKGKGVPKRDRYDSKEKIVERPDDEVGKPMFEQSAEMKKAIKDAESAHDVREQVDKQIGGMSGEVKSMSGEVKRKKPELIKSKPKSKKVTELRSKQRDLRLLQEERGRLGFFARRKRKQELDSAIIQKQQEISVMKDEHVIKSRRPDDLKKESESISKKIYLLEEEKQKLRFYQIGEKRKIRSELSHLQSRLSGLREDLVKEKIVEVLR